MNFDILDKLSEKYLSNFYQNVIFKMFNSLFFLAYTNHFRPFEFKKPN